MLPQIKRSDFIEHENRYWMTAESLGDKLGFSKPRESVNTIFSRNRDELTPFSSDIKLMSEAGLRNTTVFDEQGCYIIAMLAKTEQAKQFRRALAQFLKGVREQQLSFFEMQDEYDELRQKLAKTKLEEWKARRGLSNSQFKRLIELKDTLTIPELAKLFDIGTNALYTVYKLHRHANGDFSNTQPLQLQSAQGGQLWMSN